MTTRGAAELLSWLVRGARIAVCACAARRWQVDLTRSFGGVALGAEVRLERTVPPG